jgi:arsenate reductase-like glutaredoxin family protein
VAVGEKTDARQVRKERAEALALARTAERLLVVRGNKVVTVDMKKNPPDDDTLARLLLGPSGNLRAPTFRRGRTLLVGFNEMALRQLLEVS